MSNADLDRLMAQTRDYFRISPSDDKQVGVLYLAGRQPMPLHSGHSGGPWGGTQRGNVPRGRGSGYSSGAPSEKNIGTHVEGHAIAKMHEVGATNGTLVVSKPPCGICDRVISIALPKGARLKVIHPDAGSWTTTYYRSRR
jgi:hypothetical protein